jgi:Tfp pilus assembly protein PilN
MEVQQHQPQKQHTVAHARAHRSRLVVMLKTLAARVPARSITCGAPCRCTYSVVRGERLTQGSVAAYWPAR